MESLKEDAPKKKWGTRTVFAIILATFFSDVSHEMCTAVLPMYLATVGLGPAALGLIEGVADFLVSLSKLAGGYVGHHVERKRPWASLGNLVTTRGNRLCRQSGGGIDAAKCRLGRKGIPFAVAGLHAR